MTLSIRQITLQYGLNPMHIKTLLKTGALSFIPGSTRLRPQISKAQIEQLQPNVHYVVCQCCGAWAGQISKKHLNACSGIDLDTYKKRWPQAQILSAVVKKSRRKTEAQKLRQSMVLKKRFKTPEGHITREQIREAGKRLMQTPYRDVATKHLTALNQTEARRSAVRKLSKDRWDSGIQRSITKAWHEKNRALSLKMAAYARSFMRDKTMKAAKAAVNRTSKMHLRFKYQMVQAGLKDFMSEASVGPFQIDEACFSCLLAVEIDGCYWHGCQTCGFPGLRVNIANDKRKNQYLKKRGWHVLRIPGHVVLNNPEIAIQEIQHTLAQLKET